MFPKCGPRTPRVSEVLLQLHHWWKPTPFMFFNLDDILPQFECTSR